MYALHPGVRKPLPLAQSHADFPASEWMGAPIGFAGGQWNLTAYCDNDPVNYTDRTGMYGENVHFYATFMVASLVGYKDPHMLAYYSELPDEMAKYEAIPNSVDATKQELKQFSEDVKKLFEKDEDKERKYEEFMERSKKAENFSIDINKYLHSLCGEGVVSRRNIIRDLMNDKIKNNGEEWEIGFLNHALGDAYAHATKGILALKNNEEGYPWRQGHARDGHRPDIIKDFSKPIQKYKNEKLIEYMTTLASTLNPNFNAQDAQFQNALSAIYDTALKDNNNVFTYSSEREIENLRKLANNRDFLQKFNKNAKTLSDMKPFDSYQPEKSGREILNDPMNPARFKSPTEAEVRGLLDEIKAKCQAAGR